MHKLRWKHIYWMNSSMCIEKVMRVCTMRRDNLTSSGPISFTASICCYGGSEMPEQSLSSRYLCIITVLHDCVLKQQHPPPKAMTAFIVLRLLALRCKSFIIYEKYYIQWLLLVLLVIFSASLPGSDDFVLFDSLDGNGALFANVLCNIPVLRIILTRIFGWKHS